MVKQKHFIDIQHIIEEDSEFRKSNTATFEVGDLIQISEKIDNSNASITYDAADNCLVAFSRKQTLSFDKTLNGFWNYVQALNVEKWKDAEGLFVFGEWSGARNKLVYNEEQKRKWFVYDIYDTKTKTYKPQEFVKEFCKTHDLIYVHVLYEGPFISWEHCRSFMNSPAYGDMQEGIVVKNQSKLNDVDNYCPAYLKIVNEFFHEKMKQKDKPEENPVEKEKLHILVSSIVTKNRIEKELFKMRDEGLVPEKLTPVDMKEVARNLPKRIYEDCLKEDKEIVLACGEKFGKVCGSYVMKYAREIICGE